MTSTNTSHYALIDDSHYVDSNFINNSKGKLPNSELKHLGFGEFYLQTENGNIHFIRQDGIFIDGFVGRTHRIIDDKDGYLVSELIKAFDLNI